MKLENFLSIIFSTLLFPALLLSYTYLFEPHYGYIVIENKYIESIFMQFSHINEDHLKSNLFGVLLFGLLINTTIKSRYFLLISFFTFIIGYILVLEYINGKGFSIVTNGIVGSIVVIYGFIVIEIFSNFKTQYIHNLKKFKYNRNYEQFIKENLSIGFKIMYIILIIGLFITSVTNIIGDLIIFLTSESVESMNYAAFFLPEIPSEYTDKSAKGHSIGFIAGYCITLVLIIIKKDNIYRNYIFTDE